MTVSRRCLAERFEFLVVLASLCAATSVGCSKSKPEVIVVCREEGPTPVDASESVRNVLAGLRREELQVLWEFLPPSYRSDVEKLVHDFGSRLDEKSWEPFVATCRKARLVTLQLIQRVDEAGESADESDRELAARLRIVAQLLSAVCESELSDVARLRRLDALRFLGDTGHALLAALLHGALGDAGFGGDSFSQFGEVQVELSDSAGDSSVLSVQWPGQEATQHKFVRVEERWIPQTLAEAWPSEFPKVREQCLAWADELRSNPEPWHARLREIDQLLDELAATKSLAETRQVWQTGASRLAVTWFGMTSPVPPQTEESPAESPPSAKPVRVKRPDTEVLLPDEPQK